MGAGHLNSIWNGGLLILVVQQCACCRQLTTVYSLTVVQQCSLACADVYSPEVALHSTQLVRCDDHRFVLLVETQNIHHNPLAAGNLLKLLTALVHQVKVVVSVLLALHNELRAIPWQELYRVLWLYIFV